MDKVSRALVVLIIATAVVNVHADGPFTIIRNLLQNNLVGAPVIHKVSTWDFDPDVSLKRREQFQELHGFRGEKLIERIGLGIDGKGAERLPAQQARDQGVLGGSIHHIKHGLNVLE